MVRTGEGGVGKERTMVRTGGGCCCKGEDDGMYGRRMKSWEGEFRLGLLKRIQSDHAITACVVIKSK